jgi:hypothetical protein
MQGHAAANGVTQRHEAQRLQTGATFVAKWPGTTQKMQERESAIP